jgi:hypothetical protein
VAKNITEENKERLLKENSDFLIFLMIQKGAAITVVSLEDDASPPFWVGLVAIGLMPPPKQDVAA